MYRRRATLPRFVSSCSHLEVFFYFVSKIILSPTSERTVCRADIPTAVTWALRLPGTAAEGKRKSTSLDRDVFIGLNSRKSVWVNDCSRPSGWKKKRIRINDSMGLYQAWFHQTDCFGLYAYQEITTHSKSLWWGFGSVSCGQIQSWLVYRRDVRITGNKVKNCSSFANGITCYSSQWMREIQMFKEKICFKSWA